MKVLAVGDIHTKIWIIDMVEGMVDNYDVVVFVGDYADDFGAPALHSILTWQRMRKLMLDHKNVKAVRGNHDYIYTVQTPSLQSGYDHVTQALLDSPEHKSLKKWLTSLPITLTINGVVYSHAGIDKRWDGEENVVGLWQDTSPIWIRPPQAHYKAVPQVVGHTPVQTVIEVEPNIWLIDTFSTYPNGNPIGDGSMLEIVDGKHFKKVGATMGVNAPQHRAR